MCSVYFNITKICQSIFVWGMSNQYYMVNTCLWQRNTLTFNNFLYECIYMYLANVFMYLLFTNLLTLSNYID